jgi:hypothetical protein
MASICVSCLIVGSSRDSIRGEGRTETAARMTKHMVVYLWFSAVLKAGFNLDCPTTFSK